MLTLVASLAIVLLLIPGSHTDAGEPRSNTVDAVCLATPVLSPVAAAVRPAIVAIRPAEHIGPLEGVLDEWLDLELGARQPEGFRDRLAAALRNRSVGAGVIVDPTGLVLTSAEVLRVLREVQVVTTAGESLRPAVVGIDQRSGIALLRLPLRSTPYPYVPLGDSDSVRVGDWVLAYGAPFGLDFSVSAGIVSAINRDLPEAGEPDGFLQTDAPLNAGNTGGPLFNLRGEVVGIAAGPGQPGVSFAVSSNVVRKVYDGLRTRGYVSRAWLGVAVQPLSADLAAAVRRAEASGVLVVELAPNGPAARAEIRRGDVLLAFDDAILREPGDLDRELARRRPEGIVRLRIWRDGRERTLRLPLGEEPPGMDIAKEQRSRALGVEVAPITPEMGVVIIRVAPGTAAEKHGVRRGDVIREIDGQQVPTMDSFARLAKTAHRGKPVLVLLQRGLTAVYVALHGE